MEGADIPAFGEALATLRTRVGLSQQQLAKQLGKNRRSVAAWEGGEYLPKAKGDVLELARIFALNDRETMTLLKAAGIDPSLTIWNVPFPRNPFFTGRNHELAQLHAQLQQGTTAVVGQAQSISGLGGVGKTQFAVECAYRHQDEYQYVLWARAESADVLTSSFTEIAHLLKLPEKEAQEQAVTIQAVKRWLQRQRGWLLIIDNADNPALLPDFLPPTVGGHLLITTRAADASAYIPGLTHPLVLETFSDEQGALFLLHRSGLLALDATLDQVETHARQLAREIAYELGGLPLALDQAGAYINATKCSLAVYQQIYQQHRAQVLAQRRGANHPEPVATTWTISFRNVEQQNSAAADLLRLCAFFAPDAIPEELLIKGADELGPPLGSVVTDAYLLNEAIENLRAFSLIVRDPHAQSLSVHRLVQAVLRDSMSIEIQHQWMQHAVQGVNAAFPSIHFEDWPTCERLLPHALICATWIERVPFFTPEAARLLNQTGYYLVERGLYEGVNSLYKRALAIYEHVLGASHPLTARSLNNLANLYRLQEMYEEVEPLLKRTLVIYEQALGVSHPNTARCLNDLAGLYRVQRKYGEAESLYKRALEIKEQQLGADHPDTARSLNNLANFYQDQGRYVEAGSLYKRAIEIKEQKLGVSHPHTAMSLSNLALLYTVQGRYEEAEPLSTRALEICQQQLGSEHPTTKVMRGNHALLLEAMKNQKDPTGE